MILSSGLILIILAVGVLIGGVGIGGVLLVPSLKYLGNVPFHSAIPACLFAYILTGAVGVFIYARKGTINWSMAVWVCIGALPGAFLGAYLLPQISAMALEIGMAILLLGSGIHSLTNPSPKPITPTTVSAIPLLMFGFVSGIGSALSGTGGPLVLIPLLIWNKIPVLVAIGLSQAIQIPIALTATAGNLYYAEVDFVLAGTLAVILAIGAALGGKFVHHIPVETTKKLVAWLLIGVGMMMLGVMMLGVMMWGMLVKDVDAGNVIQIMETLDLMVATGRLELPTPSL